MRTLFLAVFFLLVPPSLASNAEEKPCLQFAKTQQEMNACAADDLKRADAELHKVYQQVLAAHAADPDKGARFVTAQRAWIKFRDAEIDALFPELERTNRGSVLPMCHLLQLERLTLERTKALKQMLQSTEGDVCSP
jgi:uncharacterized protein YecT (DUF1311 family)